MNNFKLEYLNTIKFIDNDNYEKTEMKEDCIKYINNLQQENKKNKQIIDNLIKDLELIIEYAEGEEASRWDKMYSECARNVLKLMESYDMLKKIEE